MKQSRLTSLLFTLFLVLGIPESEAECYWRKQDVCKYRGNHYKIGESWKTNDCFVCTCLNTNKVTCCDMVNYSVDFSEHCDVWYDEKTCQLSLLCGRSLQLQKSSRKSDAPVNKMHDSHSTNSMT